MSSKNDQIFQLSLTEIAFIIIFLLMILLGLTVFNVTRENQMLKDTLSSSTGLADRQKALETITNQLAGQLRTIGVKDPDAAITKLVEAAQAQDETTRLKVLIEDKDRQLTALAEVEKILAQSAPDKGSETSKKLVMEAVLTIAELKKLLQAPDGSSPSASDVIRQVSRAQANNQALAKAFRKDGVELTAEEIQDLVQSVNEYRQAQSSDTNPGALKKLNADLRGQIVYLQNKLNARGGIDFPPCWVDETTGKIQMLFSLEMRSEALTLEPAWPASRQEDAMALPGMAELLATRTRGYDDFMQGVKRIFEQSKAKECRFYVRLKSLIPDAVQSDRKRYQIEGAFYKVEVRR